MGLCDCTTEFKAQGAFTWTTPFTGILSVMVVAGGGGGGLKYVCLLTLSSLENVIIMNSSFVVEISVLCNTL